MLTWERTPDNDLTSADGRFKITNTGTDEKPVYELTDNGQLVGRTSDFQACKQTARIRYGNGGTTIVTASASAVSHSDD